MAKARASLGMSLLVLFLALAMAGADPGPKQVKCQDKTSSCYHVKMYCPAACLRTCEVDCASCQPVCTSGNTGGGNNDNNNNNNNNNNNGNNNGNSDDNNGNNSGGTTTHPPPPVRYPSPPPPSLPVHVPPPPSSSPPIATPPPPTPLAPAIVSSPPLPAPSSGSTPPTATPPLPPTNSGSTPPNAPPTTTPPPPPTSGGSTPPNAPPTATPPPTSGGSTPPNSPPSTTPPSGGSTPPNAPPTDMPPPSGGSTPPNSPPTTTPPPTWYPPPPPSSEVSGTKRVRCKNRNYPRCYVMEQSCPSACPSTCEVDCVTCKPVCSCDYPGAVCQDPRFIGGDGITFYFHGKKSRDFCLVSDSNLHINAHFIGRRNANMRRDFTWVQSLGILFGSHNLFVGALKTSAWDDAVDRLSLYLDGTPITLPQHDDASWYSKTTPRISFTRYRDTNAIEIEVEKNFKIKAMVVPITRKDSLIHNYGITNEDCFAHLDLSFKFYALSGEVSGVLGQTYARNYVSRAKMGVAMPVLGGEREFASSGLFTTDCAASRFIGQLAPRNSTESFEYADLECAGGVEGRGVVCKR